ncbi:Wiscott-Aldrich syndrome protein [Tieghemostelium lacteum]|uniref:Wiscott-Aldrich syndrome protein n=1 Tax=Tieghemostelium lacteum TaxID=361077 RepID=A0A151ZCT7_TIELA|nr:Wiscott-Aldrich syndrome protein [Tieghemostelium lacteum]|eukprot:KYQ91766.1 Wiscott-Aldrich syndrome protein [Tieghemostelium lacteum]
MGNQTLTDQEKGQVAFVHGSSCTVLSTTVARLYDGKSGRWEFTGAIGAVSIITDRVGKVNHIKIVDLKSTRCIFEQELYDGFDYQKPRDFFHTFEGDSQVFGLSFADVAEAAEFYAHVLNCKSGNKSNAVNPNTSSGKVTNGSSLNLKKEEKKKKSGGFMSKLFGGNETQELEISAPSSFQHKSHIGWDPEKGFDIRDIPADWRKLFQSAGIKKSEIKDLETAKFLVNVVSEQLATQGGQPPTSGAVQQPSRPGPPPPPPTQRSNPPPPPTKSNNPPPPPPVTRGNAPPPPPPTGGGPPPPPPPPPSGGPPPPPPPSFGATATSGGGGGGGGGGRTDLLASIREGKSLKAVDKTAPPPSSLPDISGDVGNRTLISTLQSAMANRRQNMGEDEDQEEDDDDDDWSDY